MAWLVPVWDQDAFVPSMGWKATSVQVELLRLPEQMAGVGAIRVFMKSDKGNSLCKLRTF